MAKIPKTKPDVERIDSDQNDPVFSEAPRSLQFSQYGSAAISSTMTRPPVSAVAAQQPAPMPFPASLMAFLKKLGTLGAVTLRSSLPSLSIKRIEHIAPW